MNLSTIGSVGKRIAKERVGPWVAARQPQRIDLPLDVWDLSIGPSGGLHLGEVDLVALAQQHGTPLHVVDAQRLERAARAAMSPYAAGQGADIFYSYKTNPVPAVLGRLHAAGVGAEVISAYEFWLARRLGVPGERIIYNGPAKSDESLREAIRVGTLLINANSLSELRRIISIATEEQVVANLGIRVSLPGMWGGQFGLASWSSQVEQAVNEARSSPAATLRGLHVHRGGTIRTETAWRDHVAQVLDYCDLLSSTTGWWPEILDLGGSLACPTSHAIPTREFRMHRALGTDILAPDPTTAVTVGRASTIAHELTAQRSGGRPVPLVVQEPGRALTGDSQFLLTSVLDVKDDLEPSHLVMDGGRNLCDPLPYEFHQLVHASRPGSRAHAPYRLVGPICTPADVLYYHWQLPEVAVGDVMAVMDTGAYFVPFSTAFSFPRAAIAVIDDGSVSVVRAAESFEDLVARDRDDSSGIHADREHGAG